MIRTGAGRGACWRRPWLPLIYSRSELMLVYIDESGHPLPKDRSTRPVLLAACIPERETGAMTRAVFSLKRTHLAGLTLRRREEEGKAVDFLSRGALISSPLKRAYAEAVFDYLRGFDFAAFAVVMERPTKKPYRAPTVLQTHIRWLLNRVDRHMEQSDPNGFAIPIFDGQDPQSNRTFANAFASFMAKSIAGRAMQHIVPSPLFVDSALTPGIQIADLCAYVLRSCYENGLFQKKAISDPYLSTIQRFGGVIRSKTIDYAKDDGGVWYGFTTMDRSKFIYDAPEELPDAEATDPVAVEPLVASTSSADDDGSKGRQSRSERTKR